MSPSSSPAPGRVATSLDDWRRKAAAGEASSGVLLRKAFPAQVKAVDPAEAEGQERVVEIVMGTSAEDRSHDVIETAGYELGNYLKNPVVLWAHDYFMPPIGKALSVSIEAERLVARDLFAPADVHPFGDTVYRLLKGGFLNAASVGIDPIEWFFDEKNGGIRFKRQELLEHSIVPVPCNPEALQRAKTAGIDMSPVDDWARKALDLRDELVVPRAKLEAVVKALGYGRGTKLFELSAGKLRAAVKAKVKGEAAVGAIDGAAPAAPPAKTDENAETPRCEACSGSGDCTECSGAGETGGKACGACGGDGECADCDGTGEGKRMPREPSEQAAVAGAEKREEPNGTTPGVHRGAGEIAPAEPGDGNVAGTLLTSAPDPAIAQLAAAVQELAAQVAALKSAQVTTKHEAAPPAAGPVLLVVAESDAPPPAAAEPTFSLDPEAFKAALAAEIDPLRRLFTAVTGRIC